MQNLILLIFFLSAMDGADVKFANLTAEDRWTLVSRLFLCTPAGHAQTLVGHVSCTTGHGFGDVS